MNADVAADDHDVTHLCASGADVHPVCDNPDSCGVDEDSVAVTGIDDPWAAACVAVARYGQARDLHEREPKAINPIDASADDPPAWILTTKEKRPPVKGEPPRIGSPARGPIDAFIVASICRSR